MRRFRFTVRRMMVLVALFAVFLAVEPPIDTILRRWAVCRERAPFLDQSSREQFERLPYLERYAREADARGDVAGAEAYRKQARDVERSADSMRRKARRYRWSVLRPRVLLDDRYLERLKEE